MDVLIPFGICRGMDHPAGMGATTGRGEDLIGRNLRAEFGPARTDQPKDSYTINGTGTQSGRPDEERLSP